ncbi:hypothetical protein NDU88_003252 [Pleurodeles waltl]|uniref:Uncharacterized protein n=1 Tax=Pleurodeles waltl TaxID=8319 RepID=A0AAV7TMZ8_PLEWA|nr:hypothetical protein NDU88_003252 [Pleurodeles waltl]
MDSRLRMSVLVVVDFSREVMKADDGCREAVSCTGRTGDLESTLCPQIYTGCMPTSHGRGMPRKLAKNGAGGLEPP